MTIPNSKLPKYVGWGAFLIYLVTLAHGVTLENLAWTSRIAGWDLMILGNQPLLWLSTLPLHWLPAEWAAVALNIFSAGCGAWTLSLLARTVQILPQNRTPVQRIFVTSKRGIFIGADNWAPAVLAAVLCGLEYNFWRQSVAAVGETLDLLVFASSLRWLLEYRMDRNPRHLRRAIFMWGLGMTENWAMILLLPVFLGALVWLRRRRFLQVKFLLAAALTGLVGFSVYLIPPVVNSLIPHANLSFHDAFLSALRETKQTLTDFRGRFWYEHKDVAGLVLACFLLPLLPSLFRVRSDGAYQKSVAEKIQILFYHISHLLILLGCLWVALDPVLGPRRVLSDQMTLKLPLLLFDYLAALGAGYIAGYFIVIYGGDYRRLFRRKTKKHRPPYAPRYLRKLAPMFFHSLPVLMTVLLCLRNLVPIIDINRQPLKDFGEMAASSLPPNGSGVVMCDDLMRAVVLRSAMSKDENARWQVVISARLISPEYRNWLERQHARDWTATPPGTRADGNFGLIQLLSLLDQLVRKHQVFYLHPASGYFFDAFYQVPHGSVYELKRYPEMISDAVNPPPLDAAAISAGEQFWDSSWLKKILPVTETLAHHPRDFYDEFFSCLKTDRPKDDQSALLGKWYSMDLDDWGVQLQRLQQLPAAQTRFEQAQESFTNNLAAINNLACNQGLQSAGSMRLSGVAPIENSYRSRRDLITLPVIYGPFDEPNYCYVIGDAYEKSGMFRQAMQCFERAMTLAPDAPAAGLRLAQMFSERQLHDRVINTVRKIRENPKAVEALDKTTDTMLAVTEADSWFAETNSEKAIEVLASVQRRYPHDADVRERVLQSLVMNGNNEDALRQVEEQIAAKPDDANALTTKAVILGKLNRYEQAVKVLDKVLSLTNSPVARLDRAAAYTQLGRLKEAEADYRFFLNSPEAAYNMNHGLADVAIKRHDTNSAIQYLELCLLKSSPGSPGWNEVQSELAKYKAASGSK